MPRIITASAPLFARADMHTPRETDCLFGESVELHGKNENGDMCEITLTTDGYRGWIETPALGETPDPTHRIIAPRALLTIGADIKTPQAATPEYLPFGALVAVAAHEDAMAKIICGDKSQAYLPARALTAINAVCADWVGVAESLIGAPYRWGGRDSLGMDCSALVQLALAAGGIAAPRNSSDQEKTLGRDIDMDGGLQRGDLIFWRGHVGIMTDCETLLHANMFHAMTATEPLADAITRLQKNQNLSVTRVARI